MEENIPKNSASNKIAIEIRIRNVSIKRGRQENIGRDLGGGKNSEKR